MPDAQEKMADFDPQTITTLLAAGSPLVRALEAAPRCSLLFNVFDPADSTKLGSPRSQQFDMVSHVYTEGPVYENVWWHNALFHGKADNHVVVAFRHERSWDTAFGQVDSLNN